MSPVDDLREAARLLRERAEAATPGPWEADGSAVRSRQEDGVEYVSRAFTDWTNPVFENATYIASMHPLVGVALAQVFEYAEDRYAMAHDACVDAGDSHPKHPTCPHRPDDIDRTLKLARLYLGRPQ